MHVCIVQIVVQQTVVGWSRGQRQRMPQQGSLGGAGLGVRQLQTHYTIVVLIGIQILQEEAMKLGGYGIDDTRLCAGCCHVRHELQLIAIMGQHGLLIVAWIPGGNGRLGERTKDQAAVER